MMCFDTCSVRGQFLMAILHTDFVTEIEAFFDCLL